MPRRAAPLPYMEAGTLAAILLAKLPAAVVAFREGWGVLAVALVDLVLSSLGMVWAEPRGAKALRPMLAAQYVLALALLWMTRDDGFLVVMPLVSMGVFFLPTAMALGIALTLLAAIAAIAAAYYPPGTAMQASFAVAASVGFVWIFSRLMVRERAARGEVERLLADLSDANERLGSQMHEIERLAAAAERGRIAREIHDGLGHTLTVARIQLEAAQSDAQPSERITRVRELLGEGLGELRRSVSLLREDDPRASAFLDAITKLVHDAETPACKVRFTLEGEVRAVPAAVGFTLYRGAQEALTNVRKHAGATEVDVTLAFDDDAVRLCVSDDGKSDAALAAGNGLAGLAERAALVGGAIEAKRASASAGVELRLSIPLAGRPS